MQAACATERTQVDLLLQKHNFEDKWRPDILRHPTNNVKALNRTESTDAK